jgi:hypothetical protein
MGKKRKSIGALLQSSVFAEDVFIALTNRNSLTVFTAGNKKVVMERCVFNFWIKVIEVKSRYLLSPPDLRGRMACITVTTYTRALIDEAEKQAKVR